MNIPRITLDQAKTILETKRHPRVTEDSIKAKIVDTTFVQVKATTVCLITMQNGFVFVGTSTPADVRNFDYDVGERYAYDNAFRQIWTHEGYLLREQLKDIPESRPHEGTSPRPRHPVDIEVNPHRAGAVLLNPPE